MKPYVTGPVHIYVNPQKNNILYLGTCEAAPRIQESPKFSPVMNDVTGDQEPYDMLYQGKSARIFGDLTVWNWIVLDMIMTRAKAPGGSGVDDPGTVGSLMITEGWAYPLYLQFPYSGAGNALGAKAAFIDMPAGRHYFYAWLLGPDEIDPGTKASKIHVQFQCLRGPVGTDRQPNYTVPIVNQTGYFGLYDGNMAGVPPFPPSGVGGV